MELSDYAILGQATFNMSSAFLETTARGFVDWYYGDDVDNWEILVHPGLPAISPAFICHLYPSLAAPKMLHVLKCCCDGA